MRAAFQEEMNRVASRLVETAQLVERAITAATFAFENNDIRLAETVIDADQHIDELADETAEWAIDIMARQSPVASDLRRIIVALRVSSTLERMGDLAAHIAGVARQCYPAAAGHEELRPLLLEMGRCDIDMASKVVAMLDQPATSAAHVIIASDERVDELHRTVLRRLSESGTSIDAAAVVDTTLANRYFERFGDHSVSIAKRILYLVTGEYAQQRPHAA